MINRAMRWITVLLTLFLTACVYNPGNVGAANRVAGKSYGPPNTPEIVAQIGQLDFGRVPTKDEVDGKIMDAMLPQIIDNMVDPYSTYIESYEAPPYWKCLMESYEGIGEWYAGYCIGFSWNSKNRMGGYGGKQPGQGWVHIKSNGDFVTYAWSSDFVLTGGATAYKGYVTDATGVGILHHRDYIDIPLPKHRFSATPVASNTGSSTSSAASQKSLTGKWRLEDRTALEIIELRENGDQLAWMQNIPGMATSKGSLDKQFDGSYSGETINSIGEDLIKALRAEGYTVSDGCQFSETVTIKRQANDSILVTWLTVSDSNMNLETILRFLEKCEEPPEWKGRVVESNRAERERG